MKSIINNKFSVLLILLLVSGSYLLGRYTNRQDTSPCVSKLNFIKPSIDCGSYDESIEKLYSLEKRLNIVSSSYKNLGKIKRMSIFVRDLKTSRFAGLNDNDIYYMASLLKTPLLIGGFKLAEVEPKVLDQTINYNGSPNLYEQQVIEVGDKLIPGNSYSIIDLMKRSIIYSDNTAAQILFDFYPPGFLDRIQQALGIQIKRPNEEPENLITARTYANIFRVLYNASYLTKEYSNQALSILTETKFNNGATSKLPKNTLVAHKFAERTLVYDDSSVASRQLHECGIVYADNAKIPYIFCIMTEGNDYKDLEEVIADTSFIIYDEMTKD